MRFRVFLIILFALPLSVQAAGPIGLSIVQNLNFGNLVINPAMTNFITINPNGSTSGIVGLSVIGNAQHNGIVDITGDPGSAVSIDLSPNAVTGTSMTITSAAASANSCTLNDSGQCRIQIGATLQIGGAQTSGTFPASITMTVVYS